MNESGIETIKTGEDLADIIYAKIDAIPLEEQVNVIAKFRDEKVSNMFKFVFDKLSHRDQLLHAVFDSLTTEQKDLFKERPDGEYLVGLHDLRTKFSLYKSMTE